MGETGIARLAGNLDPRAQEFRPRNPNNHAQLALFRPPLPQPVPQVYYPYTSPYAPTAEVQVQVVSFCDAGGLGYSCASPVYVSAPEVRVPGPVQAGSVAATRTLVLSSVPGDVSEGIVRRELDAFGEVRGVQMERIREGIVTIHFYDLRHAEEALREIRDQHMQQQARLRNHYYNSTTALPVANFVSQVDNSGALLPPPARGLLAGRAVWAQFIIPSATNAVPDGHNQGTIVIFNLDPEVSKSALKEIFEAFGPVKELRETPLKKHQRFVEFYDVRDAAKALREMNGKEILGKPVVIEFSRPGGHCRKFFDTTFVSPGPASFSANIPSINSSFHHSKSPKYRPLPPPPPPPPPPPLSRKFSGRFVPNVSRSHLSQTQFSTKRTLGKGSPKGANSGAVIEARLASMSLGGAVGNGLIEEKEANGPPKRNAAKKSQSNNSSTVTAKQTRSSRPWKGRQTKMFDTRFLINEDAILESNYRDSRTTVMIKNIPNKYSQKLLLNMLDNHCIHCNEQLADGPDQPLSSYDFVYLPIDFNNKCNVGYGFVNMTSPQATWRLYKAFHLQHWEVFNSRKICEVTYARVQGLEALKEHFKNSKFPCEMDHYLPVVFSPPRDGRQLTEPLPIVGHNKQPIPIGGLLSAAPKAEHDELDGQDTVEDGSNSSIHDCDADQHQLDVLPMPAAASSSNSDPNGGVGVDVHDDDEDGEDEAN
ncbi:hypothetical protein I3843_05G157800 [Carya illinoinensis]|nr:hypothetical protein I3760_05G173000 [Carya illinoinensis]KAG7979985.1 hypothetical protein I3843_05G157800 [Carya illinoinensis]